MDPIVSICFDAVSIHAQASRVWHTSAMVEKDTAEEALEDEQEAEPPREIGGRDGPDPTRYGDWEKAGRCIDF